MFSHKTKTFHNFLFHPISVALITLVIIGAVVWLFWPKNYTSSTTSAPEPNQPQTKRVELVDKRTWNSQTYDNQDGTLTTVFTSGPKFFQDKSGQYTPVNALINQSSRDPEYQLASLSNTFTTHIAAKSDQPYLIKISKNGASIELGPEPIDGLGEPKVVFGIVRDNTIIYPEIFPGIDLRYKITRTYFATEYVIKNPQVAEILTSLNQHVRLNKLDLNQTDDDLIEITTSDTGEYWSQFEPPLIFEQNNQEKKTTEGIGYDIVRNSKGQLLIRKRLSSISRQWLLNHDRQYPIVIDPTVDFYPDADPESTSVDGSVRRELVAGSGEAWATIWGGNGTHSNSVATFDGPQINGDSSAGNFKIIRRATVLFDTSSIGTGATVGLAILRLNGYDKNQNLYTPTMVATVSVPTANTSITTSDYQNAFDGTTVYGSISYDSWTADTYNDIELRPVSIVTVAGITKIGLKLDADNDNSAPTYSNNAAYMRFYTADELTANTDPTLTVTWNQVSTNFDGVDMNGVNIN